MHASHMWSPTTPTQLRLPVIGVDVVHRRGEIESNLTSAPAVPLATTSWPIHVLYAPTHGPLGAIADADPANVPERSSTTGSTTIATRHWGLDRVANERTAPSQPCPSCGCGRGLERNKMRSPEQRTGELAGKLVALATFADHVDSVGHPDGARSNRYDKEDLDEFAHLSGLAPASPAIRIRRRLS